MLISGRQAAKRLGVCSETVYNLIRAGRLAAINIGAGRPSYKVPVAELEAFIRRETEIRGGGRGA